MAIGTETPRSQQNGNGSNTAFAFTFAYYDKTHVQVYVDGVLKTLNGAGTYDYTLTAANTVNGTKGGTVTFNAAPLSGTGNVLILLNVPYSQGTDLTEQGKMPADTVEQALDQNVMMAKQINEAIGRSLKVPTTSTLSGSQVEIPDPALTANRGLVVHTKADGTGLDLATIATATQLAVMSAKGDLAGFSTAPQRVPVGADGQALVGDSSQAVGARYVDIPRKNLLINPNWLIDQINEGALYTVTGGGGLVQGPDGWSGQAANAPGVFKMRTVADPDHANLKCLELTCTTIDAAIGAGDIYQVFTTVEGYDMAALAAGKSDAAAITLTIPIRFSVTGVYGVAFTNNATNRTYVGTVTQNVANTWETKTITLTLDTTGTWLYTNGVGMQLSFTLAAGSTYQTTANSWQAGSFLTTSAQVNFMSNVANIGYIGRVQLVAGPTPMPLEVPDYAADLRKCQRYYAKTFAQGTAVGQNQGAANALKWISQVTGANQAFAMWRFPVSMRSSPTLTTYNTSAANANWRGSDAIDYTVATLTGNTGTESAGWFSSSSVPVGVNIDIHATANARLS